MLPLAHSRSASAWTLALLVVSALPATTGAESSDPGLLDPAWVRAPESYSDAQKQRLRQAVSLEAAGDPDGAEALYLELAEQAPPDTTPLWLVARALYALAERQPSAERELRRELLERAEGFADRGIALDPSCAECLLYKSAALGRLSTIHGTLWAARRAREMRDLMDRGIALEPDSRSGPQNSTLANLYFARAILYRAVPEWFWLQWVIGIRGDIDQALEDISAARAVHPARLDYQVEHGVILLCRGVRREDPESAREGEELLRAALRVPARGATDVKDHAMARLLLLEPERACESSRDGFMEIEEHNTHGAS